LVDFGFHCPKEKLHFGEKIFYATRLTILFRYSNVEMTLGICLDVLE